MRFIFGFLILMTCGCSLHQPNQCCQQPGCCQQQACCQDEAACQDCQGCEVSTWDKICGACGLHRVKAHPHYKRWEDNLFTKMEARHLAKTALRQLEDCRSVTCDFRLGYEQAFVDVSLGSCGEVPALPPANYWKNCARTAEGHQRAQQWFNGYAAGAAQAKAIYEPYNKVAHSQFDCIDWNQWHGNNSGYGNASGYDCPPGVLAPTAEW